MLEENKKLFNWRRSSINRYFLFLDIFNLASSTAAKTRALLAKAAKDAEKELPLSIQDFETGEECTINTITAIDFSGLERLKLEKTKKGQAHAIAPPAPGDKMGLANKVQELQALQKQRILEYIAKEACRESLRREVLKEESSGWRRQLMKKSFIDERIAASVQLQRIKADHEIELAMFLKKCGILYK